MFYGFKLPNKPENNLKSGVNYRIWLLLANLATRGLNRRRNLKLT